MLQIPSRSVWKSAGAISLYSIRRKPFVQYTPLGKSINRYKYHFSDLSQEEKRQIEEFCFQEIIECLKKRYENPPFNFLIPVPPNSNPKVSLPNRIVELWIAKFPRFIDGSLHLRKTRDISSVKRIAGENIDERKLHLKGAYELLIPSTKGIEGFLVIDDVYQTGSTVRSIASMLSAKYPSVPRYLVTLTALKENRFKEISC